MKKYKLFILFTLVLAGSSCKKDFLDLTINPNTPSAASPNLLLSATLASTAKFVNGVSALNPTGYVMYCTWVGYLSQSTGYQPIAALEEYQFTTSSYNEWTVPYLNISNYQALAASTTAPYYQAIAKIMMVYEYESLVDNYNNVPYSMAEQGTKNLTPPYDSGSAIYDDLVKQLDAAITQIQGAPAGSPNPSTADIMYQGNMTNWLKFANTLKLRLAIRQTNISSKTATLKAAIAATASIGYIDSTNPAQVNPGYLNSDANGGQQTPLWLNYGSTASGAANTNNAQSQANSFEADMLGKNNDPRLIRIYTASTTPGVATATNLLPGASINSYPDPTGNLATVVSTTFGDAQPPTGIINGNSAGLSPSKTGPGILKSPTMPAAILSSEESLFLQAEAAKDGYIPGDAQTFYNAGITASFVNMNAQANTVGGTTPLDPQASAAAMFGKGGAYAYPVTGTDDQQEQAIITQKWIALSVFGAFEAFNEERRTGYPNVPTTSFPGVDAPNQVTRIYYPIVEYQTNAANVAKQGTINEFTSKIFWAK
jgi:SusD/RagB-like outer membrane lipoprotein